MSKKLFIHNSKSEKVFNDEKIVYEEFIKDGPKGLVFKFYKQNKDSKKNNSFKIKGIENSDNKFSLTITKDGNEPKKFENVTLTDLSKHKELKFLIDYIKNKMKEFRKTIKN